MVLFSVAGSYLFWRVCLTILLWWDMLFGTYENPKEWTHTCGFDDDKEQQLFRMLAFKNVHHEAPSAVSARE
jgi:hypothetical protein